MEWHNPSDFTVRPGTLVAHVPAGFTLNLELCRLIWEVRVEKGGVLTEAEAVECRDMLHDENANDY
jgi:hypothetical protein